VWSVECEVNETARTALYFADAGDYRSERPGLSAGERFIADCAATFLHASPPEVARMPSGKPYLPGFPRLHVSVSHSGSLIACCCSPDGPTGIDCEHTSRRMRDPLAIARRFFTPGELQYIQSQPRPEAAFLEVWCTKEAYSKLTGEGLGSFRRFDCAPGGAFAGTVSVDGRRVACVEVFEREHGGEMYVVAVAGGM